MTESERCTRCHGVKPSDGNRMCNRCRQTMREQYYKYRKAKEQERYAWMAKLKESTPCTDCGITLSHKHMHWDHLPGFEKVATISDMIRHPGKYSQTDIDAELAKCELVCDRCHHRRGRERGQHYIPQKEGVELPCEVCGEPTYRTPSTTWNHVYCSRKCMELGNRTTNILPIYHWKPKKQKPKYSQKTIHRCRSLGIPLPDGSYDWPLNPSRDQE